MSEWEQAPALKANEWEQAPAANDWEHAPAVNELEHAPAESGWSGALATGERVLKSAGEAVANFATGTLASTANSVRTLSPSTGLPPDLNSELNKDMTNRVNDIVYHPQTAGGKTTSSIVNYPFEMLGKGINAVAGGLSDLPPNLMPEERSALQEKLNAGIGLGLGYVPLKIPGLFKKAEEAPKPEGIDVSKAPEWASAPEVKPTDTQIGNATTDTPVDTAPVDASIDAPIEQSSPGGLGKSQGGAVSIEGLAPVADAIDKGITNVKDFIDETQKGLEPSKNLEDDIYTLQKRTQSDRIAVSDLVNSIKDNPLVTPELLDKFTHFEENPNVKLTPAETSIYESTIKPLKDKSEELYTQLKGEGYPIDNYTPRRVANRGGMIDRMIEGARSIGSGNVLSKAATATKHRTMMALEDAQGNRSVVAIKGKRVTQFVDKKPTDLGRYNEKTNEQLLDKELTPANEQIKALNQEKGILSKTKSRADVSKTRLENIDKELETATAKRDEIISRYNPAELADKKFVADDGTKYTIKQATIKEIEQHTNLTYHKNALVNHALNYLELNRAARAAKFLEDYKSDPEFAKMSMKIGTGNPPKGWKATELPAFRGYYMRPQIADVFNRLYRKMQLGGDPAHLLTVANRGLRSLIFFNPLIHIPNITVHWFTEKGASALASPAAYARVGRTGAKAIRAVTSFNKDYRYALDKGTALLYSDVVNKDLHKVLLLKMGKEFETNPKLSPIAKALGYANPINLVKALYSFSEHATWAVQDVAMLQSIYAHMERHGVPFETAMRHVEKHIPNYRIPARVLNSTTISRMMDNPNVSMFGSYHYGALRSYGEQIKALVSKAPVAEKAKALDQLAMLGLTTLVIYPILDQLAQWWTGNSQSHFRRAGSTTFPSNVYKFSQGQMDLQRLLESIVTPAPATKELVQQAGNFDFFTRRPIRGNKNPVQESALHAANALAPIQQYNRAIQSPNNAAAGLFGISTPRKKNR